MSKTKGLENKATQKNVDLRDIEKKTIYNHACSRQKLTLTQLCGKSICGENLKMESEKIEHP